MEQKPEALRLADLLDFAKDYDDLGISAYPAAAELRRLQAENESLREQNTVVDQACARLEAENEALRASGKLALEALVDYTGKTHYDHHEDEVGRRACCHVVSYEPHDNDCDAASAIHTLRYAMKENP